MLLLSGSSLPQAASERIPAAARNTAVAVLLVVIRELHLKTGGKATKDGRPRCRWPKATSGRSRTVKGCDHIVVRVHIVSERPGIDPRRGASMKFNDGYWLLRQGVTASYAKEAFAVETSDSTVSIAALTRPVRTPRLAPQHADDHRGPGVPSPRRRLGARLPTGADGLAGTGLPAERREPPRVTVESDGDHVSLHAGGLTARATVAGTVGARLPVAASASSRAPVRRPRAPCWWSTTPARPGRRT